MQIVLGVNIEMETRGGGNEMNFVSVPTLFN